MKNIDEKVNEIVKMLGLDGAELSERKAYLEIAHDDIALLQDLHDFLAAHSSELSDAFYRHLLNYPQLRALLADPATLARLKQAQSDYFLTLTSGIYDLAYARDRLRIGVVHQRIGLDPKWYIGAYRKYIAELIPAIQAHVGGDAEDMVRMLDALLKVTCLDMGLALDTYFAAERQEIVEHREYAEQIVNGLPAGLVAVDSRLCVRSINPAMKGLLSIPPEADLAGIELQRLVPCEQLLEAAAEALHGGEVEPATVVIHAQGDAFRHLEIVIAKARFRKEQFLLLIAQDVTERERAKAELRESEERFRLTFSLAGIGLAHVALNGTLIRVNAKMQDILGYLEDELLQLTYRQLTHPEDLGMDRDFVQRVLDNELQSYSREKRYRHKEGHFVWVQISVSTVRTESGAPAYFIVAVEDISERRKAAEQLERMAKYDMLTQLPNRVLLQDRLLQAISTARRTRTMLAVFFIDLDRFKDVNDSLGHDAGDMMLEEVSRRLGVQLRQSDTVARLGGDEFVVLLQDVSREDQAATVAQKILASVSAPFTIKGVEFVPTGSIGISMYPRDGQDSQTLLKNADTAMYRAKANGRNNFQFYAKEMNDSILRRLRIESGLRKAIEKHEFRLYYQPQVDTGNGHITGVEALLRWFSADIVDTNPGEFIAIAEDTGLIVPIGQWVLHEACSQCKRWMDEGLPPVRMTVNVSARQFKQDIAGIVARALEQTGCHPSWLVLELTESALMDDPEQAQATLRNLRAMGVRLAIDDFGIGYSSLNYLRRFPIDTLKIDRSFINDIAAGQDGEAIVRAVIALGRAMNMSVIAEGVEKPEQMHFLLGEGCHMMQGYYFEKPSAAGRIEQLLSKPYAMPPHSTALS